MSQHRLYGLRGKAYMAKYEQILAEEGEAIAMKALRNTIKQSQFNLATAFARRAIEERSLEDATSTMLWLADIYGVDEVSTWTVDYLMPQVNEADRKWLMESLNVESDRL